jgi:hypothetical protein
MISEGFLFECDVCVLFNDLHEGCGVEAVCAHNETVP